MSGLLTKLRRKSGDHHHELFVSFRGEDTRTTVTGHLFNYLRNSGINVFFDQDQIKAGEHIRQKLRRAIHESDIYLIVFSDNYPDSKVCLWELETIAAEAAKNGGKKRILAVFYGVTRDDVRLETDLYVGKIRKHEATESTLQIQRWEESLRYVAEIDEGLTANPNEDDADLCQQTLIRVQQLIAQKEVPTSVDLQLKLSGLPNIGSTESLELILASSKSLCIEDCRTLDYLFSLPGRKQVKELKISRCIMLVEIPRLGELESLEVLIIEDCMSLKSLPNLSKLVKIEVLYIAFCPLLKQVLGLSHLESLVRMEINSCDNIHYVDISLHKMNKLENFLIQNCGKLRRLGDGFSSQNLQSSRNRNIHGCPMLGHNDIDDGNFQLSAETQTQSAFIAASVSYTGSSSSTHADTNEQEIFNEQHYDDSGTNILLASRSIVVYPTWYSDHSGATSHLTNNTISTMVDSEIPYHGSTGKMVVDHDEEYTATISNDDCIDNNWCTQSEITFEELDSWIFIDHLQSNYPSKEKDIGIEGQSELAKEEAAMAVMRHFFSSGIEMAACSVDDMASVAAAIQVLLSENTTSKGDARKRFSRNVRIAYFNCMTILASIKEEADDETTGQLYEMLMLEASSNASVDKPLSAKMKADHVTLLKAIKNELQAKDLERAACISQEWLVLVKQQWDLLMAAAI